MIIVEKLFNDILNQNEKHDFRINKEFNTTLKMLTESFSNIKIEIEGAR